jgi:hypothetical protein
MAKARTGSAMFFTAWAPRSSKRAATRFYRAADGSGATMPPGAASTCSRAAMFTPSPYTVPSAFDHVAQMDADPEAQAPLFRDIVGRAPERLNPAPP